MGNLNRRPFTELFEVAQKELVRESASDQETKYQGFVNQVYLNELPEVLPEEFIKKEAYITLVADYTTGTVTVGSGTTGVIGASTVWTSADTNKLIKIGNYNRVVRVTYSTDTLLLFNGSLAWTESSGSGLTYHLFKERYQLPSDFAFMWQDDPDDPNVVSRQISAAQVFLTPIDNMEYDRQFAGIIGDLWAYTVKWVSEVPYILVLNAPSVADILTYQYIPALTPLQEYTTGTVTFTNTTAVIGAGGMLWTSNINTANNTYYIRNDADGTGSASKWVKILTVVNDTALTLASAFGYTSGAGITYTISEISKWPTRFDDTILYKVAMVADPDNLQIEKWKALYAESVSMDRNSDGRRRTTKTFKQFFGMRGR